MRERALALGGEVRVSGAPRRGTQVLVILPDAEPAERKDGARLRRAPRTRAHA